MGVCTPTSLESPLFDSVNAAWALLWPSASKEVCWAGRRHKGCGALVVVLIEGLLGGRSGSLNQQLWPVIVLTREQLPLVFKHWLDLLVGQGGGAAKGLAPWLEDGREGPMELLRSNHGGNTTNRNE